jgi:integral membrane protein
MIKTFKWVAILEGFSYIFLFANMFITKNIDLILYKKILFPLGMVHGILFVAYILLAILLMQKMAWSFKTLLIICLASIVPFGTFYIEKKYLQNN